jgi:VIT1/CCC1 family predicted Fe2+/Mn2+ transporter
MAFDKELMECTLIAAIGIIALFNYYIAIASDERFRKRFLEMAGLSFGVAALSFVVGFLVRSVLGVDV